MNRIESNIIHSFGLVKGDILDLQNETLTLAQMQEKILDKLASLEKKVKIKRPKKVLRKAPVVRKPVVKKIVVNKPVARKAKSYVSTKEGKRFHVKTCPFAQNIMPKNKIVYKSKTKALNQGLKPCKCVK